MATLTALADRLRGELGDMPRSFVFTATGDGTTKRFQLPKAPVQGSTLTVKVGNTVLTDNVGVEEQTGVVVFDTAPANHSTIQISGLHFRYFTDAEIEQYVSTAFLEHAAGLTTTSGSKIRTLDQLAGIDEYPLVILASTMALFTLATDASFDIDITAPDGVHIPRSERYRQLMDMIAQRKEQYRELCMMLGTGMYKVEIYTLRRISRMTNRYVPIYRPMEIDDGQVPERVQLPLPNYGDVTPSSDAVEGADITVIAGDDLTFSVVSDFTLAGLTPKAEVRVYPLPPANQVGALLLAEFSISIAQSNGSTFPDTMTLTAPGSKTINFPPIAYYDVQLTDAQGHSKTYVRGKILTEPQVTS